MRSLRSALFVAALFTMFAAASVSAQSESADPSTALSLDTALSRAREASQSLERSTLEIDVARARLGEARARLWPEIGANVGVAYTGNPAEGLTVPAGAFGVLVDPNTGAPILIPGDPVEVFPAQENLGISAALELDQPIYTSGKLRAGVDAAMAAVEIGAAQRETTIRSLREQVTVAYAGVSAGRDTVGIVEELVRVLEERVGAAEEEFGAGASTRVDLLNAQSRLASARLQLVRSRQGLMTAEANLSWLIGADPGPLEELELPAALPSETELVERARAEHPALDELRTTADRAAAGLQGAISSSLGRPDLGLRVKASVTGQTIPFAEDDWKESWDANLTISIGTSATIFDGGAAGARREAAEAQLAQSRSAIAEFGESLELRIRASLERYFVARAVLEESLARLSAADEQARVARVSFENDLITRNDVLGARIGVLEAQLAGIGARLDGARALAEIEYLAGPVR